MLTLINRFRGDESGATATEYAMLVVFIALAIAVGAQQFGGTLNSVFGKIDTSLSAVAVGPLPPPIHHNRPIGAACRGGRQWDIRFRPAISA